VTPCVKFTVPATGFSVVLGDAFAAELQPAAIVSTEKAAATEFRISPFIALL
jgi:hypothetical protein